jgi:hypothetical protein
MNQQKTENRDPLVSSLVSVGSAWARYGLSVGRAALETSAQTLRTTAEALGKLADTLEQRAEAQAEGIGEPKREERNAAPPVA